MIKVPISIVVAVMLRSLEGRYRAGTPRSLSFMIDAIFSSPYIHDVTADIGKVSSCVVNAIDRIGVVGRSIPSVSEYIANALQHILNVTGCDCDVTTCITSCCDAFVKNTACG